MFVVLGLVVIVSLAGEFASVIWVVVICGFTCLWWFVYFVCLWDTLLLLFGWLWCCYFDLGGFDCGFWVFCWFRLLGLCFVCFDVCRCWLLRRCWLRIVFWLYYSGCVVRIIMLFGWFLSILILVCLYWCIVYCLVLVASCWFLLIASWLFYMGCLVLDL